MGNNKLLASTLLLRSKVEYGDTFTTQFLDYRVKQKKIEYYSFIQPHMNMCYSKQPEARKEDSTGIMVTNGTQSAEFFKRYGAAFAKIIKSRKHVHKFIEGGMDNMDLTEAE
eukprot:CAMPEP_0205828320 /NCGR_PEP_ID=MMETSP0206-20130828/34833_1 /ASSEMBLY_ACC=CAM_ASM_000279 /TAXON_ID=36767 /ORGANISM="Euplotes focardii, Strain TN1" /LENGTH=111 /DNA_ID=CAMNT_0053130065 /DNA_START=403 /DNA_END=735 /DNA_ORIENTATION=-